MIEKKGRPESRQKKGGTEAEEGRNSKNLTAQKWSLVQSSTRVKSAKSSKGLAKVAAEVSAQDATDDKETDVEKSALGMEREILSLERKKSAQGRKKSAVRLGDMGKTVTVRRFVGKCKSDRETIADEVEKEKAKNVKIWDESLEKLELKKKSQAEMDSEIGLKHIRIIPVTPDIRTLAVKHIITPTRTLNPLVLKAAKPDAQLQQPSHKGPRYDALGNIIPHSILGDVGSFVMHAREKRRKSDILLVHPSRTPELQSTTEDSSLFCSQYLNEENALKTWNEEMALRQQQQSRLADLLNSKEKSLLMYKSDRHYQADKQIMLNCLWHHDYRNNPDVCFWKIGDQVTAGQLQETLTLSKKGQLPMSVVYGDADSISKEKGKMCEVVRNLGKDEDYMKQELHAVQGTIHIDNKILFNDLQLQGEAIVSKDQRATGDHLENTKAVKFCSEKSSFQESYGNIVTSKQLNEQGIDYKISDPLFTKCKDYRGIFDFRFMRKHSERYNGPALLIGGTRLKWCCNGTNVNCNCDSRLYKEVFVLISGQAREVLRGFAKIENIGTTAIRYSWMRIPDNKPLPVQRPPRPYFYFLDDEGIVLPKEIAYVPMLFRSPIPGYFTESWLLSTQPVLEGGAKVKFTFKGTARYVPDFSEQISEIEDYLARQQMQTFCSLEAKTMLDYAVLKASLEYSRERQDLVDLTPEENFMQTNPGMYHHAHVIARLQVQYESLVPQSVQRKQGSQLLVSVAELRKACLSLPDDGTDNGDDSADDESYLNLTRKQQLLWQLNKDVSLLCFQPLVAWQPPFRLRYLFMYTMLQTCIDSVVSFAHALAENLGLVPLKETIETDNVKKQVKNKNKVKTSSKAPKGGKKDQAPEDPQPSSIQIVSPEQQQESLVFSAVHKYRTENTNTYNAMLAQYDEKMYLKVYNMMKETAEEISDLFETL